MFVFNNRRREVDDNPRHLPNIERGQTSTSPFLYHHFLLPFLLSLSPSLSEQTNLLFSLSNAGWWIEGMNVKKIKIMLKSCFFFLWRVWSSSSSPKLKRKSSPPQLLPFFPPHLLSSLLFALCYPIIQFLLSFLYQILCSHISLLAETKS